MQAPWLGTGIWQPVGTEPAKKQMTAESAPVGIGLEDAPPRLTRDPKAADAPASKSTGTPGGDKDSKAPAPDTSKPADSNSGNSGDGPPRLKKGTPSSDSSTDAPSGAPPSGPKDSKEDDKKKTAESKPAAPVVPASDSGASEGDRPVLRRGRPAVSFADVDIPGYSKPGAPPPKSSGKVSEVAAVSGDVQLIPAISDATISMPRSFTFEWLKGEESDRRKQMLDLAKDQLRAYVAARAKAKITPQQPAHGQAARVPKAPEPLLDNVQMVAYDLWNSNQAIIVLSAQAHMPPPAPNAPHSEVDAELKYSIMLVAYPDMYNNLHKLHSSVTDQFHLDLTPRLDLVDAMDADGDGRGELLFRETTDSGSGWVVYRATADKLSKMFDSLRPQ